ncbi:MAG TPA: hypothetical protein VN625_04235 [Desulfuromonadaceae bacterium]|nr:hypothetical protein [Desulfuromonadaceae bacterium]
MLGKESVLKSLAARRQALVAESDLHRTEFAREWAVLHEEVAQVARPVQKAGHYFAAGTKVFGLFMALRRTWTHSRRADGRRDWLAMVLQAARLGLSFWPAFRSAGR